MRFKLFLDTLTSLSHTQDFFSNASLSEALEKCFPDLIQKATIQPIQELPEGMRFYTHNRLWIIENENIYTPVFQGSGVCILQSQTPKVLIKKKPLAELFNTLNNRYVLLSNAYEHKEDSIEKAFNAVPTPLVIANYANNYLLYANTAMCQLQACTLETVLTTSVNKLSPEKNHRTRLWNALKAGKKVENFETEINIHGKSEICWVTFSARIIEYRGESAVLVTATDITERKKMESQLYLLQQDARAASHVKSQFLSNMSHEIRTPLNAVLGMHKMLLQSPLEPYQLDYLNKSQIAAQNLLRILDGALDFSRLTAGTLNLEKRAFSLRKLLEQTAFLLSKKAFEKHIEILAEVKEGTPDYVKGDALRIQQVLLHILENAIQSSSQGVIRVAVEIKQNTVLCLKIIHKRNMSGPIPSTKPFSILNPNTHDMFTTPGMGLDIVEQLIEGLMQGKWGSKSQNEQDSFWIEVPIAVPEQNAAILQQETLESLRVLVVDDRQEVLNVIESCLKHFGLTGQFCLGGSEALETLFSSEQKCFDLLLLDWNMPDLTGKDVLEKIFLDLPNAKRPEIVIMTANRFGEVSKKLMDYPGVGLFYKPLTPDILYQKLLTIASKNLDLHSPNSSSQSFYAHKILVVDDHQINLSILEALLNHYGFQVDSLTQGTEALPLIKQNDYDVVILDLNMPEMNGYEVCESLHRHSPKLPIIALSADISAALSNDLQALGFVGFLEKPVDENALIQLLNECLKNNSPAKQKQRETPLENYGVDSVFLNELQVLFLENNRDIMDYYKLLWEPTSHKKLKEWVHGIKGASANLELHNISETAEHLEQCLVNTPFEISVSQKKFKHLKRAFTQAFEKISRPPQENTPVNLVGNEELFNTFYNALSNYDAKAQELFEKLRPQMADQTLCAKLEKSLKNFDFEEALSWLAT